MDQIAQFDRWCLSEWGSPTREFRQLVSRDFDRIQDVWDFSEMTPSLKTHIAERLIRESTSQIGTFSENGDVSWFIHNFGDDLRGGVRGFDDRRYQPFKAALLLVAAIEFSSILPTDRSDWDHIKAGGGAMAVTYLLSQLEFLFRLHSRYLETNGLICKDVPEQLRRKTDLRHYHKGWRVSQIHQAVVMYLYRNQHNLAVNLRRLNGDIGLVERLAYLRNPVMHGEMEDPGIEAKFLALLCAMFYYSTLGEAA